MTRRANNQVSPDQTTADLFSDLQVNTPAGDLPALRVDIGWAAWRSALAATAGHWQRWRFWLALWRHFGRARYLVQVDNQYQIATSLRISRGARGAGLQVLLVQSATPWQGLWQCLLRRRGSPRRQYLSGHEVRVSRHPAGLAEAVLPVVPSPAPGGNRCPEVLLDHLHHGELPLVMRDH